MKGTIADIKTLNEFVLAKKKLRSDLKKSEKRIEKRFKKLKSASNPQKVLVDTFDQMNLEGQLFTSILPLLIKYKDHDIVRKVVEGIGGKRLAVISLAGAGIGLAAYLLKLKSRIPRVVLEELQNEDEHSFI